MAGFDPRDALVVGEKSNYRSRGRLSAAVKESHALADRVARRKSEIETIRLRDRCDVQRIFEIERMAFHTGAINAR
jgi:hypothetical protein